MKYWEQITVHSKNNTTVKQFPVFQSTLIKNITFSFPNDKANSSAYRWNVGKPTKVSQSYDKNGDKIQLFKFIPSNPFNLMCCVD